MCKKDQAGFTLIELLVVIAIIGILTTIVVLNVIAPRTQAMDNSAKSELNLLRSAGEMYYAENNTYVGFCGSDCNSGSDYWQKACSSIVDKSEGVYCHSSSSAFCAQVALVGGDDYCIDVSSYGGATAYCDSSNCSCDND